MKHAADLTGKKVLVVEDEFLVALDLEMELEESGAKVTCASTLSQATGCAERDEFDAVVLDLNLHGEKSYPLADMLQRRAVPFLFHTGQGEKNQLGQRYPGVPVCNKPCDGGSLVANLTAVIGRR
ncbi:response regulator [Aureimonas sp. AU12]|uniref:response regulator n=1 Tax=Aureimonas sp. AU12 TaxID=1638161 RepID=UPI000783866E|nr:response regulator [Aureimonas sp. AU12]